MLRYVVQSLHNIKLQMNLSGKSGLCRLMCRVVRQLIRLRHRYLFFSHFRRVRTIVQSVELKCCRYTSCRIIHGVSRFTAFSVSNTHTKSVTFYAAMFFAIICYLDKSSFLRETCLFTYWFTSSVLLFLLRYPFSCYFEVDIFERRQ